MKKIMLVCSVGMSTSLMVNRMQNVAEQRGEDIEIFATAEGDAQGLVGQVDAIMLGPQVSFALDDFQEKAKPYNVPVMVIDTIDYGRMDGEKVLDIALNAIKEIRRF